MLKRIMSIGLISFFVVFAHAACVGHAGICHFPKRGECQSFDTGFTSGEIQTACMKTKVLEPDLEVKFSATEMCPSENLLGVCSEDKTISQTVSIYFYKSDRTPDVATAKKYCLRGTFTEHAS